MAKNLADILADDFNRHTILLSRYTGYQRQLIRRFLVRLEEEVERKISGLQISSKQAKNVVRLNALLEQIRLIIRTNFSKAKDLHVSELRALSTLESKWIANSVNNAIGVEMATPILTPKVLTTLARKTPIMGSPAEEWWGRQAEDTRRRFADQIRMGFALGESTQDMVRRVRGTFTGSWLNVRELDGTITKVREFTGGVMDVTTRQAEALVRTSVQAIANNVRNATYEENEDLIKARQAHVTFDLRTSDICRPRARWAWFMDGRPVPASENGGIVTPIPFPGPPPWHFNCRSSLLPITFSWEELVARANGTKKQKRLARLADNNIPKGTRQSMDGQVSAEQTYEDWLKSKTVAEQKEVLGVGKQKLWKEGKLSFRDMINAEGRPLSLAEIQEDLGL